jgi:hypothetical protein
MAGHVASIERRLLKNLEHRWEDDYRIDPLDTSREVVN